jgi:hypothetical protein
MIIGLCGQLGAYPVCGNCDLDHRKIHEAARDAEPHRRHL